jgi:hypothetical protein
MPKAGNTINILCPWNGNIDMQNFSTQHTGQHYTYQQNQLCVKRHDMKCETGHIQNYEHNIYILPLSVVVPALMAALQDSQPESRKLYQFLGIMILVKLILK